MKTCPNCNNITFDDMDTCYDCHYSFASTLENLPGIDADAGQVARLKVVLNELCAYETLMRKQEGATINIGCATDNAIVVPETAVCDYQCAIFYSQGQLWAEPINSKNGTATVIGASTLAGHQPIIPGDSLRIGSATITVLSA
jgi:hypothetical protein